MDRWEVEGDEEMEGEKAKWSMRRRLESRRNRSENEALTKSWMVGTTTGSKMNSR